MSEMSESMGEAFGGVGGDGGGMINEGGMQGGDGGGQCDQGNQGNNYQKP